MRLREKRKHSSRLAYAGFAIALLCMLSYCRTTAYASAEKISDTSQCMGSGCPPDESHYSSITLTPTDCGPGNETRTVYGQAYAVHSKVLTNSIYLTCVTGSGTYTVHGLHGDMSMTEDATGSVTGHFTDPLTITWQQSDIAAIDPPVATNPVWCTMSVPATGGYGFWNYPSAYRLDGQAPDVDTPGNVTVADIIPLSDGRARVNWTFVDAKTPPDVDGDVDNCRDGSGNPIPQFNCNKTDTRFQYQWYRRQQGSPYGSLPAVSVSPPSLTFDDNTTLAVQDRYQLNATVFCYKMRVRDTGGNASGLIPDGLEKCFVPDGKPPVFENVIPYFDATFATPFIQDVATDTNYTVTTNPCYFDASCTLAASRSIYLKIVVSEPLFDAGDPLKTRGGNNMGYTMPNPAPPCTIAAPTADDGLDNDPDGGMPCNGNGYVDEWPNNKAGYDNTLNLCQSKMLWNYAQGECVKYPVIAISGPDPRGLVPSMYNPDDTIEFVCSNLPGSPGYPNPLCNGLNPGETIYRYRWDVSGAQLGVSPGGLQEGDYEVTLTGADTVGNLSDNVTPTNGKIIAVDNTGPTVTVGYYANPAFSQSFHVIDHDNNATTPNMPVAPAGNVYFQVNSTEVPGSTPTMFISTPANADPPYTGTPCATCVATITLYQACVQPGNCDLCTGANCNYFSTAATVTQAIRTCKSFHGCFTVNPGVTTFDGYAAVTVDVTDRYKNDLWSSTTAAARVDRNDADGLADDTIMPFGLPTCLRTWGVAQCEPDAALSAGQFFAIDTHAPNAPVLSLPVKPCNDSIARLTVNVNDCKLPTEQSTSQAVNQVQLAWTRLSNGTDDDGDGRIDEEYIDGVDCDDPPACTIHDGFIDEDAKAYTGPPPSVATATGTQGWEIAYWHLQIATGSTFAPTAIVVDNSAVVGTNFTTNALPERPLESPYYWRVAARDWAGNEGGWSPPLASGVNVFTFGVDTADPIPQVKFYLDAAHTKELGRTSMGFPVTGDTADKTGEAHFIYVGMTTNEPLGATPSFRIKQNGNWLGVPLTTTNFTPVATGQMMVFTGQFIVDALGADAVFRNGLADFVVTATDRYGNGFTESAPATGSKIFVDASVPTIQQSDITTIPESASQDTNDNGILGEASDTVAIHVLVSEYLREPFKLQVQQQGVSLPCASCSVSMTLDPGNVSSYTGYYQVMGGHDGPALIKIGSADPLSEFYATDFANNAVSATNTFTVDTVAPAAPTPIVPANGAYLSENRPQVGWRIDSRASDLKQYRLVFSTDVAFVSIFATDTVNDQTSQTSFYYRFATGVPDGTYYWIVKAVDTSLNKSASSSVFMFTVDHSPPAPPKFTTTTSNPTPNCSAQLSGTTSKPNCSVSIYVNGVLDGVVVSDASGNFTVGIDEDNDGLIDEDPYEEPCGTTPQIDNDMDGLVDEDPIGVALQEGTNVISGVVTDQSGNTSGNACDPTTAFYNAATQKCELVRDSGPPKFYVLYYSDPTLASLMPIHPLTGNQTSHAGNVYMKIFPTKALMKNGLPNPPKVSVYPQGSVDSLNQTATALNAQGTAFTATYTVHTANGSTYRDGDAKVIVIGEDALGVPTPPDTLPITGAYISIDTTPPTFNVDYYKQSTLDTRIPRDESLVPTAKQMSVYVRILSNEVLAASPTVTLSMGSTVLVDHREATKLDQGGSASGTVYVYKFNAAPPDGFANIVITGVDIARNTATDTAPVTGNRIHIDTTPPDPPTIVLPTTTSYTQVQGSGTALEPYVFVQAYAWSDSDPGGIADAEEVGTAQAGASPTNHFDITIAGLQVGNNYIITRAIDLAENVGDFSTPPVVVRNTAPVYVNVSVDFTSGWNIIGFPMQPAVTSPAGALSIADGTFCRLQIGNMKCEWQVESISPGKAYWGYIPNDLSTTVQGITSSTTQITLNEGWNMIAVPYNQTILWSGNLVKVTDGVNTYKLNESGAGDMVETNIYMYSNGSYQKVALNSGGAITPWVGFFIRAKKNCTLIFPSI